MERADAYLGAVIREVVMRGDESPLKRTSTLYFGGGTPSLLEPRQIERVVNALDISPGAEITIECNPESTTPEKLVGYKAAGINRVSFGVQSLSEVVLRSLGRDHSPKDVYRAVEAIGEAGFENYSVDLIYGAGDETLGLLEESVAAVLNFAPGPVHISAYALTVESGTPLSRDLSRYPNEDYQADAYDLIDEMLSDNGFEWYEISNWSKRAMHSRHNWNYWMQGEYLGLGCAAHSHLSGTRTKNTFNMARYISLVESGADPSAGSEALNVMQRKSEALDLLARTRVGVPASSIGDIDELEGLVEVEAGVATLTRAGRLLANQIIIRIVPDGVEEHEIERLQNQDPWTRR